MSKINNEKGAALVIVLWIIVLLVLLGTILFAQLLTTTKQMNRQEESAIKTDVINMSAVYMSTYLKQNGGTDGITEEELTASVKNMPKSIDFDGYTAELVPEPQLDKNQIKLMVHVKVNGNESTEVKYIPITK